MRGHFPSLKRRAFLAAFIGFFLSITFSSIGVSQDDTVPADFEIALTSAPNHGASPLDTQTIRIAADGSAWYSARMGDEGLLPEATGSLSPEDIATIYRVVQERNFFELDPLYRDASILDGDYAEITVTANGASHTVRTVNVRLFDFDLIAMTIDARVPDDRTVIYNALIAGDYREIER